MKTPADRAAGDLERRVLRFVREGGWLRRGATVLVAVSGGPDSLCLLHVLAGLSERLGVRLHVAHLDHMLRGDASKQDAAFVVAAGRELGLPCTVEARDVTAWKRLRRCSLEEAAREVRYRFLRETAVRAGAEVVATGHTRDDAVETLLLHVIRGSGLQGLRGLEAVSELPVAGMDERTTATVRVVRPLLQVSREETREYCRLMGLAPRQDASNESLSHLRNRIRLELLPQCRGLNPKFDDALLRLANTARLDDDHLEQEAARSFASMSDVSAGRVRLDLAGFAATSPALQSRLVRLACGNAAGDLRDLSTAHVRAVRRLVAARPGKRVRLVSGVVWIREESALIATTDAPDGAPMPAAPLEPVDVPVPGEVTLPGWNVSACLVDAPSPQPSGDAFTAVFDAAAAGSRLFVRRRRPGDRFRPLGMDGEKKLQDFMVDAGIPLAQRDGVPLLCSPGHIVWVVGWRMDDRVKVSDHTRTGLRVTFRPAD